MRSRMLLALSLFVPSTVLAAPPTPGAGRYSSVRTYTAPQVPEGSKKVTFQTGGVKLNGNSQHTGGQPQEITLAVPKELQSAKLAHIELNHSQNLAEKSQPWSGKKTERDQSAPYSQIEVYVEGRGWTNLGQPKKFAEARQEVERLHDLPNTNGAVSAVRVRNVGVDPVHVNGLTLHFLPPKPKAFDEAVFMPGASFGDAWSDARPRTGRNRDVQVQGTRYPGGVTLNNNGNWSPTPKATMDKLAARGWTMERDSLVIPLTPGKRFRLAEVAIGDTQPDPNLNGDGSYGRKGYAKLNLIIERANGSRIVLTSNENIPSEGVMVGTSDHVVQAGDRLRVQATFDTAGLMGVRLGYDESTSP